MTGSYAEQDVSHINAGRLWGGGLATAVVAGLLAEASILVSRKLLRLPIFAPEGAGLWGNADTTSYAVGAGLVALAATGLLHFLLTTTPRATVFFGWIMALLTVVAVVIPLNVTGDRTEMIATTVLNLFIGLIVTALLISTAGGARTWTRHQHGQPSYESRNW